MENAIQLEHTAAGYIGLAILALNEEIEREPRQAPLINHEIRQLQEVLKDVHIRPNWKVF